MKNIFLILRTKYRNNLIYLLKNISFFLVSTFLSLNAISQVAINEDNSAADTDVELDIKSTTKGVLLPILSTSQRDAIPSPATGLMIFNRSGGYFNVYDGSNWQQISRQVVVSPYINPTAGTGTDVGVGVGVADPDNSAILHVNDTIKGFLLPRIDASISTPATTAAMLYYDLFANEVVYYDGTTWISPETTASSAGAGGAGVAEGLLLGGGTIDASAKMEVTTASNKGMFLPRMTDAERDAIDSPAESLLIYNTTANEVQYYTAFAWYKWAETTPPLGSVEDNPGQSCKDIYDNNAVSVGVDGVYWIDPDGAGGNAAYQATCDMTRNGGGWTLVVNTGSKRTNMENPGTVGTFPILTSLGAPSAKLSDADINLVRGTLATSIVWIDAPFGNGAEEPNFFKQNTAYKANSTVHAESLYTFHYTYANAIANIGQVVTPTRNNAGAFHSWNGAIPAVRRYIMSWGGEQLITGAGTNNCSGTDPNPANRSLCNGMVWVKQP